jgi:hypothetical protein
MTRISSLIVASTLAILPISAFAQQTAAPAKTTAPTSMTTATPATAPVDSKTAASVNSKTVAPVDSKTTAPVDGKTAAATTTTKAAKPEVKTPTTEKNQVHGMNTVAPHHAKTVVPAKS